MKIANEHDCPACREPVTEATGVAFWACSALGVTVLRVHRDGDCEQRALAAMWGGGGERVTLGPTKEERRARDLDPTEPGDS